MLSDVRVFATLFIENLLDRFCEAYRNSIGRRSTYVAKSMRAKQLRRRSRMSESDNSQSTLQWQMKPICLTLRSRITKRSSAADSGCNLTPSRPRNYNLPHPRLV